MNDLERRRDVLASLAAGAAAGLAGCTGGTGDDPSGDDSDGTDSARVDPAEWRSFHADAANSGHHPSASAPTDGVSERWRFDAEESVYGSPTVVDDTVYAVNADGTVFAADAETGEERWRYHKDGFVAATPAVADGTLYVGGMDARFSAIDVYSGDLSWGLDIDDRGLNSPTVDGDRAYVGGGDGAVYAIDVDAREVDWSFDVSSSVVGAPAVADGTVYAADEDGTAYAIDPDTGDSVWNFTPESTRQRLQASAGEASERRGTAVAAYGESAALPFGSQQQAASWEWSTTVDGGRVYLTDGTDLYAIDAETGDRDWHVTLGDGTPRLRSLSFGSMQVAISVPPSPAVADGVAYLAGGESVHAFDAAAGDRLWRTPVDAESAGTLTAPASQIAVGDAASPGGAVRNLQVASSGDQSPVVADGTVFFGAGSDVLALDAESGDRRWRHGLDGSVTNSAAVAETPSGSGTVYVGTADGGVYALAESEE